MRMRRPRTISRRKVLADALLAVAGIGFTGPLIAQQTNSGPAPARLLTRAIPGTKERLPIVGLGTNNYGVTDAAELESRREVLRQFPVLGGKVVDTAPAYGRSEVVVGTLVAGLGNRDTLFLATKVTARDGELAAARAMLEESFKRLRTDRIDLLQVHNLTGADALIPVLHEWKAQKRIRYVGITTSNDGQYDDMTSLMRRHPLDFVQVDYSIANRSAADMVLPLAQERGVAVLINMPFGGRRGGNLFGQLAGQPLPAWAAEIDATSWAQVLLKYCISHSAVTCVLAGTTKLPHLQDNLAAARGRLPDAALRKSIEAYWDANT